MSAHLPGTRLLDFKLQCDKLVAGEVLSEYWRKWSRPDPITFGTEVLGLKPSPKQLQYGLNWYTDDQKATSDSILAHKRTLVQSCNGGGKTFWDALVALWAHNLGFRVLITATTLDQANKGVGAEIKRLLAKGPPGLSGKWADVEIHARYIDLHELVTFSVKVGTEEEIAGSAAGRHYERMCLIIDEANSVNQKLIEQVDRICLSPHDIVLATMNPTPPTCYMRAAAEIVGQDGPLWNVVKINGENHPNVVYDDPDIIPGAITREMIADQLAKAGGNRKHFLFAPPVLGEFADSSVDGLIKEEWIMAAMARWEADEREDDYRGTAVAADIAGAGGDASSIWKMNRWRLDRPVIPESFVKKVQNDPELREAMPTLKAGAAWLRDRDVEETEDLLKGVMHTTEDARVLALDATGMGQGPAGTMRRYQKKLPKWVRNVNDPRLIQRQELRMPDIIPLNFQQSPDPEPTKMKYKKLKDQMLWGLREGLRLGQLDIPPKKVWASWGLPGDVNIMEELLRCVWGIDATGHLVVADKRSAECADDQMRDRVKTMPTSSPNELHGIAMVFHAFKKLTPGPRPLEDNRDLERERAKRLAERDRRPKNKRKSSRLPWHTR